MLCGILNFENIDRLAPTVESKEKNKITFKKKN